MGTDPLEGGGGEAHQTGGAETKDRPSVYSCPEGKEGHLCWFRGGGLAGGPTNQDGVLSITNNFARE